MVYGTFIKIAELHPQSLKPPYRFLLDGAVLRPEKIKLPHVPKILDELLGRWNYLVHDARAMLRNAQENGIDTGEEELELENYETSF